MPAPLFVTWYQCLVWWHAAHVVVGCGSRLTLVGQLQVSVFCSWVLGKLGRVKPALKSVFPEFEFDYSRAARVLPVSLVFLGMVTFNKCVRCARGLHAAARLMPALQHVSPVRGGALLPSRQVADHPVQHCADKDAPGSVHIQQSASPLRGCMRFVRSRWSRARVYACACACACACRPLHAAWWWCLALRWARWVRWSSRCWEPCSGCCLGACAGGAGRDAPKLALQLLRGLVLDLRQEDHAGRGQ